MLSVQAEDSRKRFVNGNRTNEWRPRSTLSTKAPIEVGLGTFVLTGDEAGPTAVALQFEYAPKGGPIGNLSGKVLDKQFTKGFHGYYTDLDSTATQHSTSCPAPSTEPPGSTNATALFPVAR